MKRVDTATSVAVIPAYAAGPNPGQFFTDGGAAPGDGTIPSAQWFNMITEEICKAILDYDGVALSATDDTQLRTFLDLRIKAIRAHATDTGVLTNTHLRALLAAATSRCTGARSAVVASTGGTVSGTDSAIIASDAGVAAGAASLVAGGAGTASGTRSAVIASGPATVVTGGSTHGAVIASSGTATSGDATSNDTLVAACTESGAGVLEATGEQSAVLASAASGGSSVRASGASAAVVGSGTTGGGDCEATGDRSLVAASFRGRATNTEAAVIAGNVALASGLRAVVIGSVNSTASGDKSGVYSSGGVTGCTASGEESACIASTGGAQAAGKNSVVIGCSTDARTNSAESVLLASEECEMTAVNAIGGGATGVGIVPDGAGNDEMTWRINCVNGEVISDMAFNAGGADYAEYFEALGQGADVGMLLTRVPGGGKVSAAVLGDRVLGVVSATPGVVGNGADMGHHARHARDEWGRKVRGSRTRVKWPSLYEDRVRWHEVTEQRVRWPALRGDALGEGAIGTAAHREAFDGLLSDAPTPCPQDAERYESVVRESFDGPVTEDAPDDAHRYRVEVRASYEGWLDKAPRPVPDDATTWEREVMIRGEGYDPSRRYVPRADRKDEWTCVGLLGQLLVRVEKGVGADDWIEAGEVPGVGRKAAGPPVDGGARVECMEITSAYDKKRGYAIARCVVRP